MPKLSSPKSKGSAYERELAAYFRNTLDLEVWRSSLSTKLGQPTSGNPDLAGLPGLAVEAKRHERSSWNEWFAQAARNASSGEIPIVINRRNREALEHSKVMLYLKDFTTLYRSHLTLTGRL